MSSFSGGTVFLEKDDGLIIIAVTSNGINYNCITVGYYISNDLFCALDLLD